MTSQISMLSARHYSSKIIEKCPLPKYNTGCTFCKIPEFPSDKQIDFTKNLGGTATAPWKHVLILLHGYLDFDLMPPKIEFAPNSLASELSSLKKNFSPAHPVNISNVIIPRLEGQRARERVLLYPDNKIIEFDMDKTFEFVENYLLPEADDIQETYNPFSTERKVRSRKLHDQCFYEETIHEDVIVICGHTQRDIRCGKIAPLLRDEFEKVLEAEGMNNVKVGLISHVGGHAYAGNVLYFPRKLAQMPLVFYGRVFPEHVQGIVDETLRKGNIIKLLYRGTL